MVYLYAQVQSMRRGSFHRAGSARVRMVEAEPAAATPRANGQAARNAYAATATPAAKSDVPRADRAAVAARMAALGLDVPALARRMQMSEEEVRLLLRPQGAHR
jgi:hypothetical protein